MASMKVQYIFKNVSEREKSPFVPKEDQWKDEI